MSAQIRSRSLYAAGLCALLGAAACTDDNFVSPSRGLAPRAAQREISVSNPAITLLSVEVGGGKGTQPLLYNLRLSDGRSKGALATVAGENRQLVVRGYDASGVVTHEGKAVAEVVRVGQNEPLSFELIPTGEGKGVAVYLDVVGEEPSRGGSIVVESAQEVVAGQRLPLKATVYDREGRRMEVDPREIHWAVTDPRVGMADVDKYSTAWFDAYRSGRLELIGIYKDIIKKWPIKVLPDPFVQIAAGFDFTCGRRTSGIVSCWGDNLNSQLGTTTTQTCYAPSTTNPCSDRPVNVSGGRTYKSISSGRSFVCGIETNDRISCWGNNNRGQLGIGSLSPSTVATPTSLNTTMTFAALTTGGEHACAIANTTQRAGYCWGMNGIGQLGDNNPGYFSFNPMQQTSPVAISGGFGWTGIAAGKEHTCGFNTAGRAMCWGSNYFGEIGIGPFTSVVPVPTYVNTPLAPAFGGVFSGPDAYGTCWTRTGPIPSCHGANSRGQAGIGGSSTTVGQPASVWGSPPFLNIALGTQHACAIDTSDNLWCWGDNTDGQIGFSIYTWYFLNHPLQVGTYKFASVTSGGNHSCALTRGGDVFCWGKNDRGQLGIGSHGGFTSTPTQVQ